MADNSVPKAAHGPARRLGLFSCVTKSVLAVGLVAGFLSGLGWVVQHREQIWSALWNALTATNRATDETVNPVFSWIFSVLTNGGQFWFAVGIAGGFASLLFSSLCVHTELAEQGRKNAIARYLAWIALGFYLATAQSLAAVFSDMKDASVYQWLFYLAVIIPALFFALVAACVGLDKYVIKSEGDSSQKSSSTTI